MSGVIQLLNPTVPVAAVTYATWNPSDKSANVSLSAANLAALGNGGSGAVRATQSKSAGKWYWEATYTTASDTCYIGVANATASLASYIGGDTNGWGMQSTTGNIIRSWAVVATGAAGFAAGDVAGFALDLTAGTLQVYKNGVLNATVSSGVSGALFPAVHLGFNSKWTANFGASAFAYTPPSGYNAGVF